MTDENKNLTDEELADIVADKLVFFASTLPADDDAKQAFVEGVSQMSLPEAAELCVHIEDAYINYKTHQLDVDFENKVREIKDEFEKTRLDVADQTLKDLNDLEAEIDLMNQPK